MVKEADERISSGEYTTIEDLEKNREVVICRSQLPYFGILKGKPI
jgi:hypothetical protein